MHSKSDIIEIMSHDKGDKAIAELVDSPIYRHQIGLGTSLKSSDFIIDCVHFLYHKCHEKTLVVVDYI